MTEEHRTLIVAKNVAGLYKEPSLDSEMVSQAVMGHSVSVEEEGNGWVYVRGDDGYAGWIQERWTGRLFIPDERSAVITSLFADALRAPDSEAEIVTKLVATSIVETLRDEQGFLHIRLADGQEAWIASDCAARGPSFPAGRMVGDDIVRTARRFLGVPYLWGGTTPFGLDCSGFVQLVFRMHGTILPRDARLQAADARLSAVSTDEAGAGDLVFFAGARGNGEPRVNHVGIACGDGTIIHSTNGAGVVIRPLDGERSRRDLWGVRRVTNPNAG